MIDCYHKEMFDIDSILKVEHRVSSSEQVTPMDVLTAVRPSMAAAQSDVDLNVRPSSSGGDANITLWQFLLELLVSGEHPNIIQWTNREGEFKLLEAEEVAKLWGHRKGKRQMNYDKLSRALRYYYDKDIIKKVIGQKFVYRFVNCPEGSDASFSYMQYARSNGVRASPPTSVLIPPPLPMPKPSIPPMVSRIDSFVKTDTDQIKKEYTNLSDSTPLSLPMTSMPLPSVSQPPIMSMSFTSPPPMSTSDYASLNVTGISTSSGDTPSPTDSSSYCSPNSVCSSSGLSSVVPGMSLTPPNPSRSESVHSDDSTRKRKASPIPESPPAKSSDSVVKPKKTQKPLPLNLTATQYLNPTLPVGVISPLNIMAQMSPLYLSQQMQLYALASASLYGPNSPFQAAVAQSPFNKTSPLSTPKASQIFKFPPEVTTAASVTSMANLMSPQNFLSAGLSGGSFFKFPSDCLKTPTINTKTQVPMMNTDL